jgi:hypothetical protein
MEGQKKLFANTQKNPALGHAMQVLGPMLSDAGINKKNAEDYYQFLGTLHTVMQQKIEDEGKLPKDEDIKTIGAGLLRQQTSIGSDNKTFMLTFGLRSSFRDLYHDF